MQVKYKMDDNIEELVNKWDETVKSLASSEIIYFKRYYYLPDIHDTVEKNIIYTAVVYIKSVQSMGTLLLHLLLQSQE